MHWPGRRNWTLRWSEEPGYGNSAPPISAKVIPRPMKARRCISGKVAGVAERCMVLSKPNGRERAVKPLCLIQRHYRWPPASGRMDAAAGTCL